MVVAGQMPEPVGQKPEAMLLRILPVQERFPVQGVDGKDEAPELDGDVFVLRPAICSSMGKDKTLVGPWQPMYRRL